MALSPNPGPSGNALTGSRIRQRRTALNLRQADLARAAGISASYLNLIEHNRRRIGGKLLIDLARALGVEPAALTAGADPVVFDALHKAAQDTRAMAALAPELDRIDDLASRFPGWTDVMARQQKRISALESVIDGLRDRIGHDPVLAEAMHEILSSVAAIRSTADILVREAEIDPQWRARFHRNLHEEAERLSRRATEMLAHFEDQGPDRARSISTPQETVEAMFDAAGHHFPAIEDHGHDAIAQVMARAAGMEDAATRDLAQAMLEAYADDAARLPFGPFLAAAQAADFDPEALLPMAAGDAGLVLRRLAALPVGQAPDFGLAICDAAGALLFRRRLAGFSIPRFGAGCPLWPLYRALTRPHQPERIDLDLPSGLRFRAWAVAQPRGRVGFGLPPVMQAVMLLRVLPEAEGADNLLPVGPGCHVCTRSDCAARRGASVLV